jgi:rubrerythrin
MITFAGMMRCSSPCNSELQLTAAGQGTSSADTEELSIQIAQLEDTIEMYKEALEKFENDSREVQAKVILDLDLVKRSDLDEALRKGQSLETSECRVEPSCCPQDVSS